MAKRVCIFFFSQNYFTFALSIRLNRVVQIHIIAIIDSLHNNMKLL